MENANRLAKAALVAALGIGGMLFAGCASCAPAQQVGSTLSGSVKSDAGGKLEGVTVSARAAGQTISTSVFTDEEGNFYFPRMAAGKSRVRAQADGFTAGKPEESLK